MRRAGCCRSAGPGRNAIRRRPARGASAGVPGLGSGTGVVMASTNRVTVPERCQNCRHGTIGFVGHHSRWKPVLGFHGFEIWRSALLPLTRAVGTLRLAARHPYDCVRCHRAESTMSPCLRESAWWTTEKTLKRHPNRFPTGRQERALVRRRLAVPSCHPAHSLGQGGILR